jgi:hypothetical protein
MISATANWKTEAAKLVKRYVHLFEITGYSRSFATRDPGFGSFDSWIVDIAPVTQSAQELKGTSALNDLAVTVADIGGAILGDFPFVFQGRECTLKTGFVGLAEADYALMHTYVVDRVESVKNNTAWKFTCKPRTRLVKKTIFKTGDNGGPTGSDDPKTFSGNPMTILNSQILQGEVGLAAGDIDVTTIQAYRDLVFPGIQFNFSIEKAPEAKAFIEKELLAPLGLYALTLADGKFSIRGFLPLPGTIVSQFSFSAANVATLPTPAESELINVVIHRFDHDGDKFAVGNVEIEAASESKFSQQGSHVIESLGMRSALQGFGLARLVAQGIFNRFADKNLTMNALTAHWDEAALLEIGDFVELSHPFVPNRVSGALGITDQFFVVTKVSRVYMKGQVKISLADAEQVQLGGGIDPAGLGPFLIAPASVPEWTAASQGQKDTYMFVGDKTDGKMSDDVDAHPLA